MAALERWMRAELDERRVEPNSGLGARSVTSSNAGTSSPLFLRVAGAPAHDEITNIERDSYKG